MNEMISHALVAMCAIAIIAVYALSHGVDSNVAYIAIVAIAGLGGYEMTQMVKKNNTATA